MNDFTTQLTVNDRAEKALAFATVRADVASLVTESGHIVAITDRTAYNECHAARMRLRDTRIAVQKRGKEAREDSTAFSKAVIAKEKELVGLIEPEENRLGELQAAVDDAKEREKVERETAERERVAAVNARFDAIRSLKPASWIPTFVEARTRRCARARAARMTARATIVAELAKAPRRPSELISASGRSPVTIYRLLYEMESRGLIRRRSAPASIRGCGRPGYLFALTESRT